jgi:hypothetical protein
MKATLISYKCPPIYYKDGRMFGPPGAFIDRDPLDANNWVLCCPNCGQAGGPKKDARWTILQGSFLDVSTLTLSPSILKSCCGWHGYLVNGVFSLTPNG